MGLSDLFTRVKTAYVEESRRHDAELQKSRKAFAPHYCERCGRQMLVTHDDHVYDVETGQLLTLTLVHTCPYDPHYIRIPNVKWYSEELLR